MHLAALALVSTHSVQILASYTIQQLYFIVEVMAIPLQYIRVSVWVAEDKLTETICNYYSKGLVCGHFAVAGTHLHVICIIAV